MGPCHRPQTRLCTQRLQSLSPLSTGTTGIGNIRKGQPRKRLYSTFKVTNGITLLFCRQERWKTTTMSGLPSTQRRDDQEHIPATTYLRSNGQVARSQILYETGHTL